MCPDDADIGARPSSEPPVEFGLPLLVARELTFELAPTIKLILIFAG